jgi:hypothetical protein
VTSSEINGRVFELLEIVEDDPSLPHELRHFIYGDDANLVRVREQLAHKGYEVFPLTGGVLAVRWFQFDEAIFDAEIATVEELTIEAACQYDGWETATRQPGDGGPLSLSTN